MDPITGFQNNHQMDPKNPKPTVGDPTPHGSLEQSYEAQTGKKKKSPIG